MEIEYQLPRFTRYLRTHGCLEPERSLFSSDRLQEKVDHKKNRELHYRQYKWSDFCKSVEKSLGGKSALFKQISSLRNIAKDLCGEEQPSEVVDEAALFLINLFFGYETVHNKHRTLLKQMFGNKSCNIAEKIFSIVSSITEQLPEECLLTLNEYQNGDNRNGTNKMGIWKCPALYNPPKCWVPPKTDILCDLIMTSTIIDSFSMTYNEAQAGKEQRVNTSKKLLYGKSWMINEVKRCYKSVNSGVSVDDLCDSLTHMLTSSKSDDELQNELFELLGFDNFELIESLLSHRKDIVLSNSIDEKKALHKNSVDAVPNDFLVAQVVVKSQEEKQLERLARKEEKKLSKLAARDEPVEENHEFDPVALRAKRIASLNTTVINITNKEKKKVTNVKEIFPHVYDQFSNAQRQAGYVSGMKLLLPDGVERKDSKQYEEVNIPASEQAPVNIGNKLVPVSTLDEVGQTAFASVKNLNRIQSVVFETAYNTNENLLICAPTGAGKTNIALLTIIHEVRNHIADGTIKTDQFKIVYVAPMKALAAEMTANFSKKLNPLGIIVRELTGDMQLTKKEILQTQILVTTPEKWDVVTRKGTGDVALTKLVKLLIIDEVHLLHGDRGPVVEALVARTLRQVESSQSMIRIVGLSATLPNYLDVARFLNVNPYKGLFYFDGRFRPVPLKQTFIGVKAPKPLQQMADMDSVCYDKVFEMVQKGHQVMVFVHARNATVRTADVLIEMAKQNGHLKYFQPESSAAAGSAAHTMAKAKSKQLGEMFSNGFSVHHAGLLRSDRNIVEKYFDSGLIKVLVCTSTLAWGVNLPAHAVIIRGTEIYDAKHGTFVDLGILDVLQIFGRAGRPQFDTSGHGFIITTYNKLSHYLSLLTNQVSIESNFINFLADNLNAEVSLGTITNVDEAVEWLSYTYLFVRMRINPQVYGLNYQDVIDDLNLDTRRKELIDVAAKALDKAKMIRYNQRTGDLAITDLGRTASNFYIKYNTVEVFNELMAAVMSESEILSLVSHSQEFQQLKVREDEMIELDDLLNNCEYEVAGGKENLHGKINILMQTFLSRARVNSFSLMSDLSYITQNAVRIMRALFEITLRSNNALLAGRLLQLTLMMERRQWHWETPLRQFPILSHTIIEKIEQRDLSVENIRDMDVKEIGAMLRHQKMGAIVKRCAFEFPLLEMSASLHPITRTVLRVKLSITPNFSWNDKVHGKTSEPFWIWVEEPNENSIYHSEYFLVTRKQVIHQETQEIVITMPLCDPIPPQYIIKATSDRWLRSVSVLPIAVQNLILPESHPPHTELLDLQPLPVSALKNHLYESIYKFSHFNPIQTQIFHCLYHTDCNVLIGAPTGSGKTIVAEIAMFRVFSKYPGSKVVYVAPLKALVREKIQDWTSRLGKNLSLSVVELTGDVTPDVQAISRSDVIVTTPEKWDGISRSWQTRSYVQKLSLIILDEVHLLGEERGPVLEVIVSRTNFISAHTERPLRIVALSTALANARDLANWLGIKEMGLYNFRPSVRPVPLEVHINGFPGKHYCPRMATMNKPTFQAICQHSPSQPALVFVSSRRQTRLTALDLIAYLAAEDNPKQWMHTSEQEMDQIISSVKDSNLRLTLAFGIGLHHAGLQDRDRKTVEELFVNQKIQVLIATATLAWGVNLPAHLVVVKGTEYYDGKTKRYVDMPITDVLQMMGRAGRPQYDNQGVAVILVHDVKKNFYRKFLYEPFPVESSLLEVLPDHLSAEVVAGTIKTKQEALEYLTWTYFFRRLLKNPTYYGLESLEPGDVNGYLSQLVNKSLNTLYEAGCISIDEDERSLTTTSMGRIAAYYYLSHQTMLHLHNAIQPNLTLEQCLRVMCDVHEYSQLPVRHNEDILNGDLAKLCPWPVDALMLDSSHIKTNLLLQAHFSRLALPCADYYTDLKSVLDQAIRVLQGMMDVSGESGWLPLTLRIQQLIQMIIQGRWLSDSPFTMLPHIETYMAPALHGKPELATLPNAIHAAHKGYSFVAKLFTPQLDEGQIEQVYQTLRVFPILKVSMSLQGFWDNLVQKKSVKNDPIEVFMEQEYVLLVNLIRINKSLQNKAYTPQYHKGKSEGWFLTLGNIENGELLAMKRVSGPAHKTCAQLSFYPPQRPGLCTITLYVMSDTYLGIDQQYNLELKVSPEIQQSQLYSLF